MTRKRMITFAATVVGAVLALLFFEGGYRSPVARWLYDLFVLILAVVLAGRIRPARTVRGEVLRLCLGVLIGLISVSLASLLFVTATPSLFQAGKESWLLLVRILLAFPIAWTAWSLLRLGGASWYRRRRSTLVFGVFVLMLTVFDTPPAVFTVTAFAFALFVVPWHWIERLTGRDAWLILLLIVTTPFACVVFFGGLDVNLQDTSTLAVSYSSSRTAPLEQSPLIGAGYTFAASAWFMLPLRLVVALFQGLFGIRVPIWLKVGTSYLFSTLIPGLLLLLLIAVAVYLGIGSMRAATVRELIQQDLRELEQALVEGRIARFAAEDSVSAAAYRRVFPAAVPRGQFPQPSPFAGAPPPGEPVPGPVGEIATMPESFRMFAQLDSLLGEIGPMEVWVKQKPMPHAGWSLPDTLAPFPGWTFASSSRRGILPVSAERSVYAAAVVREHDPSVVDVAMMPLNQVALERYKRIVRVDITVYPLEVFQMREDQLNYQLNVEDEPPFSHEVSSVTRDAETIWEQPIYHGLCELQTWPGRWSGTSTMLGQVVVSTSLAGLFSSLYAWEGMNRITIIAILVLATLFGIALLFSTLLAGGITRTIMRSVKELRQGTDRLRQGDLEVRIDPRSNDELGDLASSFNQMTSDLRRMISEVTVKERLEREIQIARRIQVHLLPSELPQRPTLQVAARSDPAFEVGGDYYDCIDLGERGLLVALGDVSGKGVGAAVLMSNLQASLSLLAEQNLPLAELVSHLNVQVYKNSTSDMFITFFLALFDPERNTLAYVNAGHDLPILLRYGRTIDLGDGGLLLGIMPEAAYTCERIELRPGDVFAAYSDGITEAMDANDVEFGRERLIQTLDSYKHYDAAMIVNKVLETVREYAGAERAGRDDLTLLAIRAVED